MNVLRLAAGLTTSGNCVPEADVALNSVIPLITVALPDLAKEGSSSAQEEATTDCDFSGTATTEKTDSTRRLTLTACIEGSQQLSERFQFDGTIDFAIQSGVVTVNLEVKDLSNGHPVDFSGEIQGTLRGEGGFAVSGGPLLVTGPKGHFNLRFDALAFDANGQRLSGAIAITDDDRGFTFTSVAVTVSSSTSAEVHEVFDDGRTVDFHLEFLPIT